MKFPVEEPKVATEKDIVDGVMSGDIFGIIKCDIEVPPSLISYFSDFPPIFKNTKIDLEDIGEHMLEYARSIGRTSGVKKSLISSMFGRGIIILTPLFKKYIEMGLVVTSVEWVLEYYSKPVFRWFANEVSDDRRLADMDPDMAILGETSKCTANSSYGKCCIDKGKHNNIIFCSAEYVARHIRDPFFKSLDELEGGIYEVVKKKRRVVLDTPIQIAIAVYSYAKLSLLEFWEFLEKYLDPKSYCLMECDTDSLYIAISRDTLDDCVKDELKDDWKIRKYDFLASDSLESVEFNGRFITKKAYEKRTPGKYKLEFKGIGMACLNSKVYHIWSDQKGKDGELMFKTSTKGMQKTNMLGREEFLSVLSKPKSEQRVLNSGFVIEDNITKTYTQRKKGLNYFYCKREVLSDGISTTHLDI